MIRLQNKVYALMAGLALVACSQPSAVVTSAPAPAQNQPEMPSAISSPEATPSPPSFWVQPGVPQTIAERVIPVLAQAGLVSSATPEEATLQIVLDPGPDAVLRAQWVYALTAPFPTAPDDVLWTALQSYWRGDIGALSAFETPPNLLISTDTADLLIDQLGPVAESVPISLIDSSGLIDAAWSMRPSISIIPFEQLEPRWKVLTLDGLSVLDKTLDVSAYPLAIPVGVVVRSQDGMQAANLLQQSGAWQDTNRDPARLSVVVMTGVTAMARATAMQMELRGYSFPAEKIMPFFANADILHTSNEVAFSPDCPEPQWTGEPKFCSQREYYALLEAIGLDVVELTGNHINDWGTAAFLYTLDMYDMRGLPYYGGGRNLADSMAPRILTTPDGTRFAFLGCNSAGPFTAWATDSSPGAAPCGDWTAIMQHIAGLKAAGQADVVIVTLQYVELPQYAPSPQQVTDFERLAAAGADIVSGSQAHQPQGFSFLDGKLIHYGVGNLFFDQMDYIENRQMFADKHVFYAGKHISTVLFTGMMEHWAQPRPMTPEERAGFLDLIFEASGW